MRRRSIDWIGKKQKIHFNKYWSEKKTFATSVAQKKAEIKQQKVYFCGWVAPILFCFVCWPTEWSIMVKKCIVWMPWGAHACAEYKCKF